MLERTISIGHYHNFYDMGDNMDYHVVPLQDTDPQRTCPNHQTSASTVDLNQIPLTVTSDFFTTVSDEEEKDFNVETYNTDSVQNTVGTYNTSCVQNTVNSTSDPYSYKSYSPVEQRWSPVPTSDTRTMRPAEEYSFATGTSSDLKSVADQALRDKSIMPFVKEELKSSIQLKRLKEGKGELKVAFDDPLPDVLTPDEEIKVEHRRTQNREAARRFRDRQKRRTEQLQKQCNRLEADNQLLRTELAKLRQEKDDLSVEFKQHLIICPLMRAKHHAGSFLQTT